MTQEEYSEDDFIAAKKILRYSGKNYAEIN